MGVMIPDMEFSKIDILRELENVRNNVVEKSIPPDEVMFITNGKGEDIPINLRWGDEHDYDISDFTVIGSRKKRNNKKIRHLYPNLEPGEHLPGPGRPK